MQLNQHICCIGSHVAEFASNFFSLFSYVAPCRLMEVQDRYECLRFYYAVIDIAVVLGCTAMEKIFPYGLTLCRRICPTSVTSSRLCLWASRFPSVFS